MREIVKSRFLDCPACGIELGQLSSGNEFIRCETKSLMHLDGKGLATNLNKLDDEILGFSYTCWRCSFSWFEKK